MLPSSLVCNSARVHTPGASNQIKWSGFYRIGWCPSLSAQRAPITVNRLLCETLRIQTFLSCSPRERWEVDPPQVQQACQICVLHYLEGVSSHQTYSKSCPHASPRQMQGIGGPAISSTIESHAHATTESHLYVTFKKMKHDAHTLGISSIRSCVINRNCLGGMQVQLVSLIVCIS